ncbi:unnamed protein product, partial [Phaeothamnion confervicola]
MGAGASASGHVAVISSHKLRNILIIRAYNTRPVDMTLSEQLEAFAAVDDDGRAYLDGAAIAKALRLEEAPRTQSLLQQFLGGSDGKIAREALQEFLEKDNGPKPPPPPVETRHAPAYGC